MIGENKKIDQAITFVDNKDYRQKAINYIEKDINGVSRFAIMKTTENGKYMRGNMLYYSLNGVSIYTEDTNIIFVDLDNNTMFIRNHDKAINEINPTGPESKEYVILYTDLGFEDSVEEFPLRWESVTGRTNTYENIKINADVIDIDKSIVIAESVSLKDALSVREFMNYLKNSNIIDDDSFDINDYSGSDYI